MSICQRGRLRAPTVVVDHFSTEDSVRVAVLGPCPYCRKPGHRHALPVDVLPTAELRRIPKCRNARGNEYRLVLPENCRRPVASS